MVKVLLHENSATWEFKQLAARSFFNHTHLSSGLTAEREGFDKAKSSETAEVTAGFSQFCTSMCVYVCAYKSCQLPRPGAKHPAPEEHVHECSFKQTLDSNKLELICA